MIHIWKYRGVFIVTCLAIFYSCEQNRLLQLDSLPAPVPSYFDDSALLFDGNPFSPGKAELGRYFFYDRRMSFNQTKSCASCHDPSFSFTDGYRRSIGALGDLHQRNSAPLINLVYYKYLTSGDSTVHYPEDQLTNPMFRSHPVELGWTGNEEKIIERLKADSFYMRRMMELFPNTRDPFSVKHIQYCIASFVKTILSFNSPFDRFSNGNNPGELSESQKKGMALFFSGKLACNRCHGGINFATPSVTSKSGEIEFYFNTGLYNLGGIGQYPPNDKGLFEHTGTNEDMGKFRVPTLRNLAFTAPYFHDGSAATLSEVLRNYEDGGRRIEHGPLAGDGRKNPYKSSLIKGFRLTSQERSELLTFLMSLSDSSICNNSKYANPFINDETER